MALWGFFDQRGGKRVYANCRADSRFPGGFDCILNYPHWHYDPEKLLYMPELSRCTVLTDESLQIMDAYRSQAVEVREITYFGRQATKGNVDWHWDTVEHTDIAKRIRKSWHYQIRTTRIPRDPNKALIAIRVEWRSRYSNTWVRRYFANPRPFFGIYNDDATIRKRENA